MVAGAIISGALQALPSIMNTFGGSNSARKSFEYSKQLQEHQYNLNRLTRQTAFGDTRKSLEDADYNPMLAVSQQAQGGTFGASLNVQDPKSENLQNALNTTQALVNIAQQRSQAKLNSAQSNLADTQSTNDIARLNLESTRNSSQVAQIDEQTRGMKIENDVNELTMLDTANATLENIKADTTNKSEQAKLSRAQQGVANATVNLIGSQTSFTQQQTRNAQVQNSAIRADIDNKNVENSILRSQSRDAWREQKWKDTHPKDFNRGMYMKNYGLGAGTLPQYLKK